MINYEKPDFFYVKSRYLRIMKLISVFLVLGMGVCFAANTYSQNTRFSINLKNVTVRQVMNSIEKNSDFVFFYYDNVVDVGRRVTVSSKNETVYGILDEIFRNTDNAYYVNDRQIYITKRDKPLVIKRNGEEVEVLPVAPPRKKVITGKVVDDKGEPVIGASVMEKGTRNGTITNTSGQFSLSVGTGATLQISYIGYTTQVVKVTSNHINIVLKETAEGLNEVVVVGYGTQLKKFLVGSVAQIDNRELNIAPTSNISNMLTGKLPGLTSVQRSGMPGNDRSEMVVRGFSTFNDPSPLLLVDGVEREVDMVNPNDVESVTVLKDAATSAIYGVKAANGVIMITTKKGSSGKATFTYNGSVSFQKNTAFPKFLNGPDYLYWYGKACQMDGIESGFDAGVQTKIINNYDPEGKFANTDWLGAVFKDHGLIQQHNVSVSGGKESINYYVSLGIMDQDGITENTNYKRYNFLSNLSGKLTNNISFDFNLSGFYEKHHWPGISMSAEADQNPIQQAIYALPIIPMYYQGQYTAYLTPGSNTTESPIATIRESGYSNTERRAFDGGAKLTYSVPWIKGLKASIFASYETSNQWDENYLQPYYMMGFDKSTQTYSSVLASDVTSVGEYNKSSSLYTRLIIRPSIEYNNSFGKNNVSALLLYEQSQSKNNTMTGAKKGYNFSDPVDLSLGTTTATTPITGSHSKAATIGYVGRFNYNYDKKYIAEFSFRYDGSYKFAKNKRWGFFPAVSVGWVASEESFIKDKLPQVDLLKLRASVGELGIDNTTPFLNRSVFYLAGPSNVFGSNYTNYYGLYSSNSVTSSLTWAKTRCYNVGLDLTVWNGLLGVNLDWFYKITRHIQESQGSAFPPSLGGNYASLANTGKVDNRGFELILKHQNKIRDFYYRITGNFSWARNHVLAINHSESTPWYRNPLGQPIGQYFGFRAKGLYQTQEELDNAPIGPEGTYKLGYIKYDDINGDGKIDVTHDFVKIGHGTTPEITYSLGIDLAWKGFNVNALFQGVAIVSYALSGSYSSGVFDFTAYTRPFYAGGNAPYYLVKDCWTPENTKAKYPRLSTLYQGNCCYPNSRFMVNGNFFRLKDLQVGYTLPQKIFERTKIGISGVKIYLAGTNLFTATEFRYCDPEMGVNNNGYYPQQKNYSVGLDVTF
jgi:TonB-linked SusC/RagA family outer membrane protein